MITIYLKNQYHHFSGEGIAFFFEMLTDSGIRVR